MSIKGEFGSGDGKPNSVIRVAFGVPQAGDKLPVSSPDDIKKENKKHAWQDLKKRAHAIGLDTPIAVDHMGRRLNFFGAYVDSLGATLRRAIPDKDIKLLHRIGYRTLCDIAREERWRIETIPYIGREKTDRIEQVLQQHGLSFVEKPRRPSVRDQMRVARANILREKFDLVK